MSKISEDMVKEKKLLELELGSVLRIHFQSKIRALTRYCCKNRIPETGAGEEKDVLASWDTQLYISFSLRSFAVCISID